MHSGSQEELAIFIAHHQGISERQEEELLGDAVLSEVLRFCRSCGVIEEASVHFSRTMSPSDLTRLSLEPKLVLLHLSNEEHFEITEEIERQNSAGKELSLVSFTNGSLAQEEKMVDGWPVIDEAAKNVSLFRELLEEWLKEDFVKELLPDVWSELPAQQAAKDANFAGFIVDQLVLLDLLLMDFLFHWSEDSGWATLRAEHGASKPHGSGFESLAPNRQTDFSASIPLIDAQSMFAMDETERLPRLLHKACEYASTVEYQEVMSCLHPANSVEAANKLEEAILGQQSITNMSALRYCWDVLRRDREISPETDLYTLCQIFQTSHEEIKRCSLRLQRITLGSAD